MARLDRGGNIFCLESFWHDRLDGDRLSVRPLLELLYATRRTKFIHLTCNTVEELKFNLRQHRRYRSFGVLYMAFHGRRGRLLLADGSEMPLEQLTELARGRLNGCLVHFGSCWTALDDGQIHDFLEQTGAAVVTGYTKSVDWIDSAAMDLLILDWAKDYSNAKSLIDKLSDTYAGLAEETGFGRVPALIETSVSIFRGLAALAIDTDLAESRGNFSLTAKRVVTWSIRPRRRFWSIAPGSLPGRATRLVAQAQALYQMPHTFSAWSGGALSTDQVRHPG